MRRRRTRRRTEDRDDATYTARPCHAMTEQLHAHTHTHKERERHTHRHTDTQTHSHIVT